MFWNHTTGTSTCLSVLWPVYTQGETSKFYNWWDIDTRSRVLSESVISWFADIPIVVGHGHLWIDYVIYIPDYRTLHGDPANCTEAYQTGEVTRVDVCLFHWNYVTWSMMTSSNVNIFCVAGPLCVEFTGYRWILRTKAGDAELWYFLWSARRINSWENNREAGDLGRHRAHYYVIVMSSLRHKSSTTCWFVEANNKLIIRVRVTGVLWRLNHPWLMDCTHCGPVMRKVFHLLFSCMSIYNHT